MTIAFYYGVYYGSDELSRGYTVFDDFEIPLTGAMATLVSATSIAMFAVLAL